MANKPIKPGQTLKLNPKTIELSKRAKALLANTNVSPEQKKLAVALLKKIQRQEFQLSQLNRQSEKIQLSIEKNQAARKKQLGGTKLSQHKLKMMSYIEKNCSDALNVMRSTKRLLFRGLKSVRSEFIGLPRFDRTPSDSSDYATAIIDAALLTTGIKTTRTNSIFCVSSIMIAEKYGDPYLIFPLNGFKFMWSLKEDDLVVSHQDFEKWNQKGLVPLNPYMVSQQVPTALTTYNSWNVSEWAKSVIQDNSLKANDPTIKAWVTALMRWLKLTNRYCEDEPGPSNGKEVVEVLNAVKQIYVANMATHKAFGETFFDFEDLAKIKSSCEKLAKQLSIPKEVQAAALVKLYGFTDKRFDLALKSGHEICISTKYLALAANEYVNCIAEYFPEFKKFYDSSQDDDD